MACVRKAYMGSPARSSSRAARVKGNFDTAIRRCAEVVDGDPKFWAICAAVEYRIETVSGGSSSGMGRHASRRAMSRRFSVRIDRASLGTRKAASTRWALSSDFSAARAHSRASR